MGYIEASHAAVGTALAAEVRGKRVPITVAAMPFIPHTYHRQSISSEIAATKNKGAIK
jgi:aminomethyltransferase